MKKKDFLLVLLVITVGVQGVLAQVITSNRNAVGLEHNVLFDANSRFTVTQSGSGQLTLSALFDGRFVPSYSSVAPTSSSPLIIEISGLPAKHTQVGAWVGWSTRYWSAIRFKIEGFNTYNTNAWVTIADYQNTDYSGSDFLKKCPAGVFTKLRITVYKATGTSGRLGISELYFIHPEAVQPYAGLFTANSWKKNGSRLYYQNGNVGIGTSSPDAKLTVAGKIKCREVEVVVNAGADFVFGEDYSFRDLDEVEAFVIENKHLPEIPSAKEMVSSGINLGEMNIKLLQKIEELTLYMIEQNKEIKVLKEQSNRIKKLEEAIQLMQLENN